MEDKDLYEHYGHVWKHFVSWREKIFAGYITALAAFAIGFHYNNGPEARSGIFSAIVLVSVVFRILDLRCAELVNKCQDMARGLEDPKKGGAYTALSNASGNSLVGFGHAKNLLVGGVIGAAGAGLWIYLPRLDGNTITRGAITFAVIVALGSIVLLEFLYRWRSGSSHRSINVDPNDSL
jgi:hypothetical protein